MKRKKAGTPTNGYKTIKIKTEHYLMVKNNKKSTGVPIEFFVGQAIIEKLQKEKK